MSTASAKSSRLKNSSARLEPGATRRRTAGFSLVEVLVSLGILAFASLGVAQLFAVATKANITSKGQTSTALLAVAEDGAAEVAHLGLRPVVLRTSGCRSSDTTTDLSLPTPDRRGQRPEPLAAATLDVERQGYVDYLDSDGDWVGNGGNAAGRRSTSGDGRSPRCRRTRTTRSCSRSA